MSRISFADGRVIVWSEELGESQYPIETLDGITLFGRPTMTTPFIVEMLKRERDIQLFTTDGHYQGRISTPDVSYAPRLRQQVHRTDDPAFCLSLSKRIVSRKILNQQALIRAHTSGQDVAESIRTMKHSLAWVDRSGSLAELNGFEEMPQRHTSPRWGISSRRSSHSRAARLGRRWTPSTRWSASAIRCCTRTS